MALRVRAEVLAVSFRILVGFLQGLGGSWVDLRH